MTAPALLVTLILLYLIRPDFYLAYVLSRELREHQAVELITLACSLSGGLLLCFSAWRLWSQDHIAWPDRPSGRILRRHGAAIIVTLIAIATIFFAGEEISWGQTYLRWNTPEAIRQITPETNLHNLDGFAISPMSLGNLFLITMFFVLPIAWLYRQPLKLSPSFKRCIAEWPVVFAMALAFTWPKLKVIYRLLTDDYKSKVFYIEFIEQLNEQKEMLVAVGLLLYSLYRLAATAEVAPAT